MTLELDLYFVQPQFPHLEYEGRGENKLSHSLGRVYSQCLITGPHYW
jgi:hypothetical protein